MQFWVKAESDFEQTLTEYIAVCQRGGQAPFQALTSSANLVSFFKPGCLAKVIEQAQSFLVLSS